MGNKSLLAADKEETTEPFDKLKSVKSSFNAKVCGSGSLRVINACNHLRPYVYPAAAHSSMVALKSLILSVAQQKHKTQPEPPSQSPLDVQAK